MKQFKLSKNLTHSALYELFGKSSKYMLAGNFYYIHFNGKDFSGDNPKELFDKVKKEYDNYVQES